MVQAAHRNFPGFGVVYPDGIRGIKVVKTFTKGSTKTVNPDGSVSYSTPPPTIHELFGGGFSYADGNPVTNRSHLEGLDDPKMREKALEWFDRHGSAMAPPEVVIKEGETVRPEPAYILSNQLPTEGTIPEKVEEVKAEVAASGIESLLASLAKSVSTLAEDVKKQREEISNIKVMAESKVRKFGDRRLKQFRNVKTKVQEPLKIEETPKE